MTSPAGEGWKELIIEMGIELDSYMDGDAPVTTFTFNTAQLQAFVDRLLSEREAQVREWKPIETAPKDGRHFLVTNGTMQTVVHSFSDGKLYLSWNRNADDADYNLHSITHWVELPRLPKIHPFSLSSLDETV